MVVEAARNIIDSDPPQLDEREFTAEFCQFLSACIQKKPSDRKLADVLLGDAWLAQSGAHNYEDSIANTRRWIRDALPALPEEDSAEGGRQDVDGRGVGCVREREMGKCV